jgi:hypothetical protein
MGSALLSPPLGIPTEDAPISERRLNRLNANEVGSMKPGPSLLPWLPVPGEALPDLVAGATERMERHGEG